MDRNEIIAGGFVPTAYDGLEGEFLTKRVRIDLMPHASEHLIDHDTVLPETEAITEVIPDGTIQFYIPDADYLDGPVKIDSAEGQALLHDALAAK